MVVIEVKRDVDRNQLAQALEPAGWARNTNLDALASHYHGGAAAFWDDWMEFTATAHPVLVQSDPKVVLVARSFDERTSAALDFLLQHKLPVQVLRVAFYVDATGRRVLDVEWESEPEVGLPVSPGPVLPAVASTLSVDFRQVTLAEVTAVLTTPCALTWQRPRKRVTYSATLRTDGRMKLDDTGKIFLSPSGAAMAAATVLSYDGWYAWRLSDGRTLNDVRHEVAATTSA